VVSRASTPYMKDELKRHPEGIPEPDLISLAELYSMQPRAVLMEHGLRLSFQSSMSKEAIKLLHLEQRDREVGLDNPPPQFATFHEQVEELSDDELSEAIDSHRERVLTLMAHITLVRSVRFRPARS